MEELPFRANYFLQVLFSEHSLLISQINIQHYIHVFMSHIDALQSMYTSECTVNRDVWPAMDGYVPVWK